MRRVLILSLIFALALTAEKRPLNHNDYDSWKHIQNQQLSNDGRYLAYAVFPQQGDGEVVVRELKTGKEFRQAAGELPPPPPPNYAQPQVEDAPPPPPGIAIKFAPDGSAIVFSTFPRRDATEAAKRAKVKAEDMPKGDVVIMKLPSGDVFRAASIKNFQLPTKAAGFVAYLQTQTGAPPKPSGANPPESIPDVSVGPKSKKVETGDLTLRNIALGTERKFPAVSEYSLTNDAHALVFATFATQAETSGVFVFLPNGTAEPIPLLKGKGKYEKLVWDDDQTRLAFLSDHDDAAAAVPEFALYTWTRDSQTAVKLASSHTPGLASNWIVSDNAPITISKGGSRIFFGTSPEAAAPKPPDHTPTDEKVSVDLWSWKDDYIQPMQKVRAEVERSRSYRAVYSIDSKTLVQLADVPCRKSFPVRTVATF